MSASSNTSTYRLPADNQDFTPETSWFFRLSPFQQDQVRRKAAHGNGVYDSIAADVNAYLESHGIERRSWDARLGSSQATALDFLFPLRQDLKLAARVLRPMLPEVKEVTLIEFGFAGSLDAGDRRPSEWLGEATFSGKGSNRTTLDAAIWWNDSEGPRITLVDWTYTGPAFGNCPGLESCVKRGRNLWVRRCTNFHTAAIPQDPEHRCYLACGETSRSSRRYWDHIEEAGIDVHAVGTRAAGCVFRGPFQHPMRQWLLAEFLRQYPSDGERLVDICLVLFAKNQAVLTLPKWMREMGRTLPEAWRSILTRPQDYRTCTVEDMISACDENDVRPDPAWRDYLRRRYGV